MFGEDKKPGFKILVLFSLFALLLLITGGAVAIYNWTYTSGNPNTISSGNISVSFLESSDTISINNAFPMPDEDGKYINEEGDVFDFSVNTTASGAPGNIVYNINITKVSLDSGYSALNDNQVKIYLTSLVEGGESEIMQPTLVSNIITSGNTGVLRGPVTKNHTIADKTYTDNYRLRLWVDNSVDGSSWTTSTKLQYKLKVSVDGEVSE